MEKGKISVLDLSVVGILDQRILASIIPRKLLKARRESKASKRIPPVLLVFEEAHRFCSSSKHLSYSQIRRVAQEGRKFGVGLGLVSQRPKRIDSDILSQCNNQFVMRITNPRDQNYVRRVSEWITEEDLESIKGLEPGEAFVFGTCTPVSLPLKIKPRVTRHGGATIPLEKELAEFGGE